MLSPDVPAPRLGQPHATWDVPEYASMRWLIAGQERKVHQPRLRAALRIGSARNRVKDAEERPTMSYGGGIQVDGPIGDRYDEILTSEALGLVARLQRELGPRRLELLAARAARQRELSAGATLDFLEQTAHIRADQNWQVAPPAPGLVDRRVEITGPTDKKMTINALNSGAKVWLADFEDANTPLWDNMVGGQLNLKDALDRTIDFTSADGKEYRLAPDDQLATIVVRPRGWHLDEKHLLVDGERVSGSLFDFALYFFHCARRQLDKGKGPYFYLAKMESRLEARLWNDAFNLAQDALGLPRGTIRATVLIETIPAAFEMEEILYELREHSAGLNAGRWDYLFSIIKKFRTRGRDFVLPERNAVTMSAPMMRAYTELLVRTCHGRGAHAMGGMAAFIPSRRDPEVNKVALAKVRDDKTRESNDGFDGSWVAHPDLVPVCREIFDGVLGDAPNQLGKLRQDVHVTAAQLLDVHSTPGEITDAGLRNNVSVGLQYLASWLAGQGAVAIFNLMEDAATAEISRSQVWQWLHNDIHLAEGPPVTKELVDQVITSELAKIAEAAGHAYDAARYAEAVDLFKEVALADDYAEFLTLPAYERMP
jgi:malate synthase